MAAIKASERRAAHNRLYPFSTSYDANRMRHMEIENILVTPTRRPLDEARVVELMSSIERVGLIHPPAVVIRDGIPDENCFSTPVLVAGRHRVEAMRRLGNESVLCVVLDADDIEAELIEITENLHRAELTKLERSEQVTRWIELTGTKQEAEAVSRQADAKPGRPEGGVRAAARELGLSEADARRSVKVASLAPEAKAVAAKTGLDDNQSALLAAAKEPTPERQVAKVKEWDAKRELELAKRAVVRKAKAETVTVAVEDVAPLDVDTAADDLALFLASHLPPETHREAAIRLSAVSPVAARAFADLMLPDVPRNLLVSPAAMQ